MDYLKEAFGGLDAQTDQDAAVKFALAVILLDGRLDELAELMADQPEVDALEGDPGWTLERRDEIHDTHWPEQTDYRAHVDPRGYALAHPETFLSTDAFCRYVAQALRAYLARHPEEAQAIKETFAFFKS